MSAAAFSDILTELVGEGNATLYRARFKELHDKFLNGLFNYEACALFTYTTGMFWHDTINAELWSGSPRPVVTAFAQVLNDALAKIPSYKSHEGLVYRGFRTADLESFLTHYSPGSTILFPGFTSAAFKEDYAFGGNILFVIKSQTAKIIWYYAAKFDEYEVLIPAGASFLVKDVQFQRGKAVIFLEERP